MAGNAHIVAAQTAFDAQPLLSTRNLNERRLAIIAAQQPHAIAAVVGAHILSAPARMEYTRLLAEKLVLTDGRRAFNAHGFAITAAGRPAILTAQTAPPIAGLAPAVQAEYERLLTLAIDLIDAQAAFDRQVFAGDLAAQRLALVAAQDGPAVAAIVAADGLSANGQAEYARLLVKAIERIDAQQAFNVQGFVVGAGRRAAIAGAQGVAVAGLTPAVQAAYEILLQAELNNIDAQIAFDARAFAVGAGRRAAIAGAVGVAVAGLTPAVQAAYEKLLQVELDNIDAQAAFDAQIFAGDLAAQRAALVVAQGPAAVAAIVAAGLPARAQAAYKRLLAQKIDLIDAQVAAQTAFDAQPFLGIQNLNQMQLALVAAQQGPAVAVVVAANALTPAGQAEYERLLAETLAVVDATIAFNAHGFAVGAGPRAAVQALQGVPVAGLTAAAQMAYEELLQEELDNIDAQAAFDAQGFVVGAGRRALVVAAQGAAVAGTAAMQARYVILLGEELVRIDAQALVDAVLVGVVGDDAIHAAVVAAQVVQAGLPATRINAEYGRLLAAELAAVNLRIAPAALVLYNAAIAGAVGDDAIHAALVAAAAPGAGETQAAYGRLVAAELAAVNLRIAPAALALYNAAIAGAVGDDAIHAALVAVVPGAGETQAEYGRLLAAELVTVNGRINVAAQALLAPALGAGNDDAIHAAISAAIAAGVGAGETQAAYGRLLAAELVTVNGRINVAAQALLAPALGAGNDDAIHAAISAAIAAGVGAGETQAAYGRLVAAELIAVNLRIAPAALALYNAAVLGAVGDDAIYAAIVAAPAVGAGETQAAYGRLVAAELAVVNLRIAPAALALYNAAIAGAVGDDAIHAALVAAAAPGAGETQAAYGRLVAAELAAVNLRIAPAALALYNAAIAGAVGDDAIHAALVAAAAPGAGATQAEYGRLLAAELAAVNLRIAPAALVLYNAAIAGAVGDDAIHAALVAAAAPGAGETQAEYGRLLAAALITVNGRINIAAQALLAAALGAGNDDAIHAALVALPAAGAGETQAEYGRLLAAALVTVNGRINIAAQALLAPALGAGNDDAIHAALVALPAAGAGETQAEYGRLLAAELVTVNGRINIAAQVLLAAALGAGNDDAIHAALVALPAAGAGETQAEYGRLLAAALVTVNGRINIAAQALLAPALGAGNDDAIHAALVALPAAGAGETQAEYGRLVAAELVTVNGRINIAAQALLAAALGAGNDDAIHAALVALPAAGAGETQAEYGRLVAAELAAVNLRIAPAALALYNAAIAGAVDDNALHAALVAAAAPGAGETQAEYGRLVAAELIAVNGRIAAAAPALALFNANIAVIGNDDARHAAILTQQVALGIGPVSVAYGVLLAAELAAVNLRIAPVALALYNAAIAGAVGDDALHAALVAAAAPGAGETQAAYGRLLAAELAAVNGRINLAAQLLYNAAIAGAVGDDAIHAALVAAAAPGAGETQAEYGRLVAAELIAVNLRIAPAALVLYNAAIAGAVGDDAIHAALVAAAAPGAGETQAEYGRLVAAELIAVNLRIAPAALVLYNAAIAGAVGDDAIHAALVAAAAPGAGETQAEYGRLVAAELAAVNLRIAPAALALYNAAIAGAVGDDAIHAALVAVVPGAGETQAAYGRLVAAELAAVNLRIAPAALALYNAAIAGAVGDDVIHATLVAVVPGAGETQAAYGRLVAAELTAVNLRIAPAALVLYNAAVLGAVGDDAIHAAIVAAQAAGVGAGETQAAYGRLLAAELATVNGRIDLAARVLLAPALVGNDNAIRMAIVVAQLAHAVLPVTETNARYGQLLAGELVAVSGRIAATQAAAAVAAAAQQAAAVQAAAAQAAANQPVKMIFSQPIAQRSVAEQVKAVKAQPQQFKQLDVAQQKVVIKQLPPQVQTQAAASALFGKFKR